MSTPGFLVNLPVMQDDQVDFQSIQDIDDTLLVAFIKHNFWDGRDNLQTYR